MQNSILLQNEIKAVLLNFSNEHGEKTTNPDIMQGWRRKKMGTYAVIEVEKDKPIPIKIASIRLARSKNGFIIQSEGGINYRVKYKKVKDRFINNPTFIVDGLPTQLPPTLEEISETIKAHKVNVVYYQSSDTRVTSGEINEVNLEQSWVRSIQGITYWIS